MLKTKGEALQRDASSARGEGPEPVKPMTLV